MSDSWVNSAIFKEKNRQFSELKAVGNWAVWIERSEESSGKRKLFGLDLTQDSNSEKIWILSPENAEIGAEVNEYGGGAWAGIWQEEAQAFLFIYTDLKRGGVWQYLFYPEDSRKNNEIQLLKRDADGFRCFYADFAFDSENQGVFAVKEKRLPDGREISEIVWFPLKIGEKTLKINEKTLLSGDGFFAAPRPSSCGRYLAFLEWRETDMAWDASQLKILTCTSCEPEIFTLAGQDKNESLLEPHWDRQKAILYALSDKKDAWNPVSFKIFDEKGDIQFLRKDFPLCPEEIGMPPWQFSQNSFLILKENQFLGRSLLSGVGSLWHFETGKNWENLPGIYPAFIPEKLINGGFICLNAPAHEPPSLIRFSLIDTGNIHTIHCFRRAWHVPAQVATEDISIPERLELPVENSISPLRALYYPAKNKSLFREGKPPLMVKVHGGPTGSAQGALDLKIQYWTSRGFAVLDVDYRGSAGYGRAYRQALYGKWGDLDVRDCCFATRYLIEKNHIDSKRCVIRGSSAGGLTALAALALENSPFIAACSLYGVTDLSALVGQGPRFEAHYVEKLVGPYPEKKALYAQRSPNFWPERLTRPVLFLHGGKDRVVSSEQAEKLSKKLPRALFHLYPEEGHGFRDPDIVVDALKREMDFYQDVFQSV